ncbi:MAG: Gfo/Idh/MocA family oxidoreductase [Clostridiales bacterium]|jgi:predicted dehydrogenase|nr:Gfo/Idh/MocA family oxidoreductase [Clostridiales bacterium]
MKIGFVGCGAISGIYLKNITEVFKELEIAGVCDLIRERAEDAAKAYSVPKIYKDMHELFADPEVDIVLNLTRPYEHYEVTKAALEAGKHVYTEKPLGAALEEGVALAGLAASKGLRLGGAPDTFLGAGIQTCRKLIDAGIIGEPVGASAFMVCRGHETWHPDPEFYYKYGGGPMFDMGPYYLTTLVNLLGGIESVSGMARVSFPQRLITSQPHYGETVTVDVPTYITGMMRFVSGALGTIFTTFDAYAAEVPRIEIYGSDGTLSVPDPNTFGGPVRLYRPERGEFLEVPLMFGYPENSRGLGLADMAKALAAKRDARASGELIFHVLEVMSGFFTSAQTRAEVSIKSRPQRPAPMANSRLAGIIK